MEALLEILPQTSLLAAASALAACVILALVSALRQSRKDAPPALRMRVPVLGIARAYLRSPFKLITHCYEK